jgi:hypothetical protein
MMSISARFRIGALSIDATAPTEDYFDRLATLYETRAIPRDGTPGRLSLEILEGSDMDDVPPVPPDGIVVRRLKRASEVHTEAISLLIDHRARPVHASLVVRRLAIPEYELAVHLSVVYAKLLALIGYVRLHASATTLGRGAYVFVGTKGSGKSTITLTLGRAGGTVLGDDKVVVRRAAGRLVASGCDEKIRVTANTERYLFPEPLEIPTILSGGVPKKELRTADLFPSLAYHEEPVEAILFPRVAGSFELIPMSRQRAVLALLEDTRRLQRFGGALDFEHYLELLGNLLDGVPTYHLLLDPGLEGLDRLADVLARETAQRIP